MNQLPVQRASELSVDSPSLTQWLVQGLWSDQAVGILGGEPKCCKSFLALDLAVSVASGAPCLRRFVVRRTGPVLLFPAEDSLAVVRRRLEGNLRREKGARDRCTTARESSAIPWLWCAGAWRGSARQP